jgi:hypothetical protein
MFSVECWRSLADAPPHKRPPQNATIFPKNVHFFATLLDDVATKLGAPLGPCHLRVA